MESESSKKYRALLVERVKLAAKEVEETAPSIVGDMDLIMDLEIRLNFKQEFGSWPTITIIREHGVKTPGGE
jgi:hypothetical protein